MTVQVYNKRLIKWIRDHYWDSLEKDKDLILRHIQTFAGEIKPTPLEEAAQKVVDLTWEKRGDWDELKDAILEMATILDKKEKK